MNFVIILYVRTGDEEILGKTSTTVAVRIHAVTLVTKAKNEQFEENIELGIDGARGSEETLSGLLTSRSGTGRLTPVTKL